MRIFKRNFSKARTIFIGCIILLTTGVASAAEKNTMLTSVDSGIPTQRIFTEEKSLFVGDCEILPGSQLILRSDGTANWIAKGRSTDTNDTLNAGFEFLKSDGTKIFPDISFKFSKTYIFPVRFNVAPLEMPKDNTIYIWGSGFIFPKEIFKDIKKIKIHISG